MKRRSVFWVGSGAACSRRSPPRSRGSRARSCGPAARERPTRPRSWSRARSSASTPGTVTAFPQAGSTSCGSRTAGSWRSTGPARTWAAPCRGTARRSASTVRATRRRSTSPGRCWRRPRRARSTSTPCGSRTGSSRSIPDSASAAGVPGFSGGPGVSRWDTGRTRLPDWSLGGRGLIALVVTVPLSLLRSVTENAGRDRRRRGRVRRHRGLPGLSTAASSTAGGLGPRQGDGRRHRRDRARRLRRRDVRLSRRHLAVLSRDGRVLRLHRGAGRRDGRVRGHPRVRPRSAAAVPDAVPGWPDADASA